MKPVWIVDDDRSIRWVLEKTLSREGIPFKSFASATEAISQLEQGAEPPQVLMSDIRMPGQSGLELLQEVKTRFPAVPVIIMTAYSDLESAVAAFQGGAFEYLPKPFDVDQAVELIRRAIDESMHQTGASTEEGLVPEILGQAPAMQEVFRAIGRLALSHATVLINGESGSGKELVARALHRHSPRADKPFIAINTAAIPKDLLESELFGHERGVVHRRADAAPRAFRAGRGRHAVPRRNRRHALRTADPSAARACPMAIITGSAAIRRSRPTCASLPRRTRTSKRGSRKACSAKTCSIVSTSSASVCRRLRERREDIPLLARHFLQKSARELGVETKRLSDAALKYLSGLEFQGNVRQLENLCHWLTVMAPGQMVEIGDLPVELREAETTALATDWETGLEGEVDRLLAAGVDDVHGRLSQTFERILIARALARTGGRRIEAALALGIGRNTITRKIAELGIDGGKESAAE